MKRFKVELRRFLTLCERKNNEHHFQTTWQTGSPNFTPPPDDNHSHLTIHRSGSLKRLFAPLCIALMGVFFVSYAQAAKVCHTEYFQPTICSKSSHSKKLSLATRGTVMCRKSGTPVRMEVCREVLEYGWWNIVFPESEHNLQDFLEYRKGQVLRDEIITVEPSVFDALKNNRDFVDIQIKGSELEQSIHFDKSGSIVDKNSSGIKQSVRVGKVDNKVDTQGLERMQVNPDLQQGVDRSRLKQETIRK